MYTRSPMRNAALTLALFAATTLTAVAQANILIGDEKSSPESLTVAADGQIFAGSATTSFVYRARPTATAAEKFVDASAEPAGTIFLGVLADDANHTLWTCELTPVPDSQPKRRTSAAARAKPGSSSSETGGFLSIVCSSNNGAAAVPPGPSPAYRATTRSVCGSGAKIARASNGSTGWIIVHSSEPTSARRASPVSARDRLVIAVRLAATAGETPWGASDRRTSRSCARASPIARDAGCGVQVLGGAVDFERDVHLISFRGSWGWRCGGSEAYRIVIRFAFSRGYRNTIRSATNRHGLESLQVRATFTNGEER